MLSTHGITIGTESYNPHNASHTEALFIFLTHYQYDVIGAGTYKGITFSNPLIKSDHGQFHIMPSPKRAVLGSGMSGTVFLASMKLCLREEDDSYQYILESAEDVIKRIPLCADDNKDDRPHFKKIAAEAQYQKHTVHVYGVTRDDFYAYIVAKRAPGIPLNTMDISKLPFEERLYIAIMVCKEVEKIHIHHIIHQDIKPANILYCQETGKVTLVDFGEAVTTRDAKHAEVAGSFGYQSPNQFVAMENDSYSLMCTLGFIFGCTEESMARHKIARQKTLRQQRPPLPTHDILQQCHKEPVCFDEIDQVTTPHWPEAFESNFKRQLKSWLVYMTKQMSPIQTILKHLVEMQDQLEPPAIKDAIHLFLKKIRKFVPSHVVLVDETSALRKFKRAMTWIIKLGESRQRLQHYFHRPISNEIGCFLFRHFNPLYQQERLPLEELLLYIRKLNDFLETASKNTTSKRLLP